MDLSTDYLHWPNVVSVRYQSTQRVGARQDVLPVAKRRPIRVREKSPSGGVYVGFEARWLLPRVTLPPGLEPKPGDVLYEQQLGGLDPTETDETAWTVLTVDRQHWGYTLALGCVDLVLALDLRDLVAIERAAITYDGAGAAVKAFPSDPANPGGTQLYQALPARVQPISREVADERGIRAFRGMYDVIVGSQIEDVCAEDRMAWTDASGVLRWLDIREVHNPRRIDEQPVLTCELRP